MCLFKDGQSRSTPLTRTDSNVFVTTTYINNAQVLSKSAELHNLVVEEAKAHAKSRSWKMIMIIQPWPILFAQHSSKTGGNVLGLERFDKNMIRTLYTLDSEMR